MPTPSSDTRRPAVATPTVDTGDTLQFRAATLEEAIALAESSLGARVRVVAANRIRRGGIGGFFAADLGVEVTVALDDETMEQALERLVADAGGTSGSASVAGAASPAAAGASDVTAANRAMDERMRFADRLAAQEAEARAPQRPAEQTSASTPTIDPVALLGRRFDRRDDEPAAPVNPVLAEVVAAIVAEAAEKQALAAAASDTDDQPVAAEPAHEVSTPPAPSLVTWTAPDQITPPLPPVPAVRIVAPSVEADPTFRPVYTTPPTMLKVEQIMAELSAITAEPVFGERSRARVARPATHEPIEAAVEASPATPTEATTPTETTEPTAPKVVPTLPPRASDVARRASDAAHAARTRFLTNQPPDLVATSSSSSSASSSSSVASTSGETPAVPVLPTLPEPALAAPAAPVAPVAHVARLAIGGTVVDAVVDTITDDPEVMRIEAVIEDHVDHVDHVDHADHVDRVDRSGRLVDPADAHDLDDQDPQDLLDRADGAHATGAPPSQRQVELAVAATDQLIESLKREDGVKRLSVRVVLRTRDRREVEAEAEWEAS